MTRVLLAPDKFKGTMTAAEVAGHLADGIRAAAPQAGVVTVPVSDGGDRLLPPDQARDAGFAAVYALRDECGSPGEALAAPGPLLRAIGARLARQFRPQRGRP